jgi:1-acyl-sn-glycerol-3-phosphate acyltransferase
MRALNRAWRLLATGISFSLFGIAGLFTGLLVFPALFLVLRQAESRQKSARAIVGWLFGAFIRIMSWLGVLTYTIEGMVKAPADDNHLIVANHPTLIDVVFLVWLFPQSECVVKEAVVRNPFMRSVVLAANYISNDDPLLLIGECVNRIKQGRSLILFPEGTRSVPGKERILKPGAAAVAVRSGASLLPVTFSCVPATLAKHEPWYEIPPKKPHFTIEVLEPVPVAGIVPENTDIREATRVVNGYLAKLFDDHCPVESCPD